MLAVGDHADGNFRQLAHPERRVAVEVGLLDTAVLQGRLLVQSKRKAPQCRTGDLGLNAVGIDLGADIGGHGQFFDRDLT